MSFKKTHVIINPASNGGKTGKRQDKILNYLDKYFGKKYSLCLTQKPLDASVSAKQAILAGRKRGQARSLSPSINKTDHPAF